MATPILFNMQALIYSLHVKKLLSESASIKLSLYSIPVETELETGNSRQKGNDRQIAG